MFTQILWVLVDVGETFVGSLSGCDVGIVVCLL